MRNGAKRDPKTGPRGTSPAAASAAMTAAGDKAPMSVVEPLKQAFRLAKAISKKIRDEGPKGVQAQIQGDQLRVTSKKRDDLQVVIALLKNADFDVALQFTNYR